MIEGTFTGSVVCRVGLAVTGTLLVGLIGISSAEADEDEDGIITGTVSAQDGTPQEGVHVTALSVNGSPGYRYTTEEDGSYFLGGIVPGEYIVIFEWPPPAEWGGREFFDDSTTPEGARRIVVEANSLTSGIDASEGPDPVQPTPSPTPTETPEPSESAPVEDSDPSESSQPSMNAEPTVSPAPTESPKPTDSPFATTSAPSTPAKERASSPDRDSPGAWAWAWLAGGLLGLGAVGVAIWRWKGGTPGIDAGPDEADE